MEIFMLLNITAYLLFTPNQPVTLEFPEPIKHYNIGNSGSYETYQSNDGKIILINPKKETFDDFLVAIGQNHRYQFRIQNTTKKLNALYIIKNGEVNRLYKLKHESKNYKVLEGETSIKVVRTRGTSLRVNGQTRSEKTLYYPKNAHLSINGKHYY